MERDRKIKRRSERVALYVLESTEGIAKVDWCERQSSGEYDLDLTFCDGAKAAVEVTSSTVEESERTLANIAKRGSCIVARQCRNSWFICPLPKARIRTIAEKADRYLSAIEAEGLREFYAASGSPPSSILRILQDLRIVEGVILAMPPPARIWIGGPTDGKGSIVRAEDLQVAVEAAANEKDNGCKLAKSHSPQRHLFVYVAQINCEAWQAMLCRQLPEWPPKLPAEITHVWAAAEISDGLVVWFADSAKGWKDLGLVPGLAWA